MSRTRDLRGHLLHTVTFLADIKDASLTHLPVPSAFIRENTVYVYVDSSIFDNICICKEEILVFNPVALRMAKTS